MKIREFLVEFGIKAGIWVKMRDGGDSLEKREIPA